MLLLLFLILKTKNLFVVVAEDRGVVVNEVVALLEMMTTTKDKVIRRDSHVALEMKVNDLKLLIQMDLTILLKSKKKVSLASKNLAVEEEVLVVVLEAEEVWNGSKRLFKKSLSKIVVVEAAESLRLIVTKANGTLLLIIPKKVRAFQVLLKVMLSRRTLDAVTKEIADREENVVENEEVDVVVEVEVTIKKEKLSNNRVLKLQN